MFTASFAAPTKVTEQAHLQALFGTPLVFLESGASVTLSGDITVGPQVIFAGQSEIRGPARIETGSVLTNVSLGARNTVRSHSVLSDLTAGEGNLFGPFCFIRDNCVVASDSILGAHVETARSTFGPGVKISHRAFVGDATLGEGVIIGAGVVFCNYDGQGRQPTTVGRNVTIGSGSLIVPPLTIGDDVLVAAGSVVTKGLPSGAKLIQKR